MSRISATGITTTTGLISGIPIEETVDQLIAVASRPRNTLVARTQAIQAERSAVDTLSSLVVGLKLSLAAFDRDRTYQSRTATSSNKEAVSVAVRSGATPAAGSYQFTPLQQASAHQIVSSAFGSASDSLGSGELRLQIGGRVNKGIALADLNAGAGVPPGRVRITDRDGATATIDLRAATTIDDVIEAINSSDDVDVTASVDGDRLVLTDNSGGSGALRVREVGDGTTAAALGLGNVSVLSNSVSSGDLVSLGGKTRLSSLGGGLGIATTSAVGVTDLAITLADGTSAEVDLSGASTLSELLKRVNENAALAGKATLEVAPDGNRLRLTDSTSGSATFEVTGYSAASLGLDGAPSGGVVTGGRLVAGLSGVLLSNLNGGQGFDAGSIEITNRAAVSATVDLSAAETLDDVISAINIAGIDIEARVNDAGTGIALTDSSGGGGSLVLAEVGAGTTAASLGLLGSTASNQFDTGSLDRQTVSRETKLSSLRGGSGIQLGRIGLRDSAGLSSTIDLRFTGVEEPTLGDVIDKINVASIGVTASLNSAGDGLLLTDTAGGSGKLTVSEFGGGRTASQLRILGESSATDGEGRQVLDGATSLKIDLAQLSESAAQTPLTALNNGEGVNRGIIQFTNSSDEVSIVSLSSAATLQDVIDKINESADGVTAALNESGTGLLLTDTSGGSGKLRVSDLTNSAAKDLRIAGESTSENDDDQPILEGRGLLGSNEPLEALAKRINDFEGGFTASVVFDGDGYRLAVASASPGAANELVATAGGTSLSFTQTSRPTDAVAVFGLTSFGGVTVASPDGKFGSTINGLDLQLNQATGEAVTVTVTQNDDPLRSAINSFVESFNSVRSNLDTVTEFDAEDQTTGILFGRSEIVRVDTDLQRLVSGRFTAGSRFASLESIGISLDSEGTGKIALDTAKLNAALASDRGAVERLFRDENSGVLAKFNDTLDRLAGEEGSLLSARSEALADTIETNEKRVENFDLSLGRQRERLLLQFFQLEESISLLQSNLSTINEIQPISFASSR